MPRRRCSAPAGLLRRDGQHPHVLLGVRQVVAQQVLEESAYRGAPAIARGGGVRPCCLDVIQDAGHRVGIEIVQLQAGDAPAALFSDERQQQRQRVAVGAHRVHAGTSLPRQVLGEVRPQVSEQAARSRTAHDGPAARLRATTAWRCERKPTPTASRGDPGCRTTPAPGCRHRAAARRSSAAAHDCPPPSPCRCNGRKVYSFKFRRIDGLVERLL